MSNLGFNASAFYLYKDMRNDRIYFDLNGSLEVNSVEKTVFELFKNFCDSNNGVSLNLESDKAFKIIGHCDELIDESDYVMGYFKVRSGSYGIRSDITDVDSGEVIHKQTPKEASMKLFYVFVIIPKKVKGKIINKGIIFFQSIGNFGVKLLTLKYIKEYFRQNKIKFDSGSLSPSYIANAYLSHGDLKKVRFIKHVKSSDTSDNLEIGYGKEERVVYDLNEIMRESVLGLFKKKMSNGMIEFEKEPYDNIKVELKTLGGRSKTINFNRINFLNATEGIPKKVLGADKEIIEDELVEHIKTVIPEYLAQMVFVDED